MEIWSECDAMSGLYGFTNTLLTGDPLDPSSTDLIVQKAFLPFGDPVPDGWRVLTGNNWASEVARVAYRFEIEGGR